MVRVRLEVWRLCCRHMSVVRSCGAQYMYGIPMAGLTFDKALRTMLTKAGFRLPGEGQKIGRIAHVCLRGLEFVHHSEACSAGIRDRVLGR